MKIAISAKGNLLDSLLDSRFGRCDFFQIHDSNTGDFEVLENEGVMAGGGAGIAAAQQLIDEDIDVIVTGNLGPNAFEILEKAEIESFNCEEISISSVLENFNKGNLKKINKAGSSHSGINKNQ